MYVYHWKYYEKKYINNRKTRFQNRQYTAINTRSVCMKAKFFFISLYLSLIIIITHIYIFVYGI